LAVFGAFCSGLPHIENKKSEWPEFVCPGFGYWPGGVCSSEFYECVQDQFGDWIAHHFNCPANTVYDPSILNCNHPEDVEGCNDPKPTTPQPTTQPPTTQPPTTQQPTSTKGPDVSTTLPASVNCHHEGFNSNPHQECSNLYFLCQLSNNGQYWNETILHCDPGMVFNPSLATCDVIDNTEGCGDVYCKEEGFNADIGSPRDCSVYFYCSQAPSTRAGWSITTCHCSHDLAFDPFLDICTWADSVPGCNPSRIIQERDQPEVCNAGRAM